MYKSSILQLRDSRVSLAAKSLSLDIIEELIAKSKLFEGPLHVEKVCATPLVEKLKYFIGEEGLKVTLCKEVGEGETLLVVEPLQWGEEWKSLEHSHTYGQTTYALLSC